MRFPQIEISTTDIRMDYTTTKPQQRIQQPQADLKISQPAATLEINTTNPKLDINQDQLWRDLGMKPTGELIKEYAQIGRQEMLKGISRRVGEGNQMMRSAGKDQGRATIQGIAKQNHGPKRAGPYNIKFIPSYNAVKVNITPGTTDINIERNEPKIDVKVNKPIHQYTPGKVTGTIVQRPEVQIDVIG
ncbi:DUF6470 family protein [Solibacillus sp. MA9]|uniref:DUF6470 family protein n=1 Tax=Solibacillus palustris TaxID=2908203 RepID=A0ABS9U9K1_9BACL|nr:DUF6470 family protein [Solibacillus sp. MA9]MCH7320648.1 DUF6470 family protein [Solibacillus sp. MA9]